VNGRERRRQSLEWAAENLLGASSHGIGRRVQQLLVSLDGDEYCSWLIAARDDQLLGVAALESIQSLGKLTRRCLAREQLIEANTQIHGFLHRSE
jgi:hypothetical protein